MSICRRIKRSWKYCFYHNAKYNNKEQVVNRIVIYGKKNKNIFFILTISCEMDRLSSMNKHINYLLITILLGGLLFLSCQSIQEPVNDTVAEKAVNEPQIEETAPKESQEEVIIKEESKYQVSEEIYQQTLDEIKELIDTLNKIISNRKYNKWKLFLSEKYINTYNDPVKLNQISEESQILSENKIILNNLKDYFEWVVVPSRSAARVDDIIFIDDTQLVVYMNIKGNNTILYQLEKFDENWEISVW